MRKSLLVFGLILIGPLSPLSASAGSLEPPGPPGPSMKTMLQVEPRTPLRNLFNVQPITPIVIDQPGSYYLTENVFGLGDQYGIRINASNVTLDLNGHTVIGNNEVMEFDGIKVFGSNVVIRNGTVRNFDVDGINCQAGTSGIHLIDLRVVGNGDDGVQCGSVLIRGGEVRGNHNRGIVCSNNCKIRDVTVAANTVSGVSLGVGAMIKGAQIFNNGASNLNCPISGGALLANSYVDGLITNPLGCSQSSVVTP
jgi:hypothetical protein